MNENISFPDQNKILSMTELDIVYNKYLNNIKDKIHNLIDFNEFYIKCFINDVYNKDKQGPLDHEGINVTIGKDKNCKNEVAIADKEQYQEFYKLRGEAVLLKAKFDLRMTSNGFLISFKITSIEKKIYIDDPELHEGFLHYFDCAIEKKYTYFKTINKYLSDIFTEATFKVECILSGFDEFHCNKYDIKSNYTNNDPKLKCNIQGDSKNIVIVDTEFKNKVTVDRNKTSLFTVKFYKWMTKYGFLIAFKIVDTSKVTNCTQKMHQEIDFTKSSVRKILTLFSSPKIVMLSPHNNRVTNDMKNLLNDNCDKYEENEFKEYLSGIIQKITYIPCRTEDTDDICSKLKEINEHNDFNVIVIARGGGDNKRIDSVFNNISVITEISKFKGYIISGIGHSDSFTIIDRIANECQDTPTTAAFSLCYNIYRAYKNRPNNDKTYCDYEVINYFTKKLEEHNKRLTESLESYKKGNFLFEKRCLELQHKVAEDKIKITELNDVISKIKKNTAKHEYTAKSANNNITDKTGLLKRLFVKKEINYLTFLIGMLVSGGISYLLTKI